MQRPAFSEIKDSEEFKKWYWLKEELVVICKAAHLPYTGSKFELRDRIIYAMENNGAVQPTIKKQSKTSRFNWARAALDLDTIITDNVSFGPNFRNFMKSQIGNSFSCGGEFMAWVKANPGKTLKDAVLKWQELEDRKKDPNFRKEIAAYNMYNQYMRDFLDDNPGSSFKDARKFWLLKKQLPAKDGHIIYEASDLQL